jgi:trimethylamine--corrinoid protein Co-methyltransferase
MARSITSCPEWYIRLTNSKINDAQAGFETGMSVVAGYLGGVDIFNMGGLLGALMAFDFSKAVIDNEIALSAQTDPARFRLQRRESSPGSGCRESGRAVCSPGREHTLERMRTTMLLAEVADRDHGRKWQERSSLDSRAGDEAGEGDPDPR